MISFHINSDERVFVSTWRGNISNEDLLECYRTLFDDKEYEPGYHEIADVTNGDLAAVTGNGLRALAGMISQKLGPNCPPFKTAIIAPRDLDYGMSRMYEVFSSESPENVRVFRSKEEAMSWIKEDLTNA